MKFTKKQKKEIKEFARRNMQYDTDNPFEATLRALGTWLTKNNFKLVNIKGQGEGTGEA